MIEELDWRKWK